MAIKLRSHDGDGTSKAGSTFRLIVCDPETGEELVNWNKETGERDPAVWIECLVVTRDEARGYYAKHTTRVADPRSRQMVDKVDHDAAADELIRNVIVNWHGFIGADDQDLVCTDTTKIALDDRIKAQVVKAVLGAEVTQDAQSFRKSA